MPRPELLAAVDFGGTKVALDTATLDGEVVGAARGRRRRTWLAVTKPFRLTFANGGSPPAGKGAFWSLTMYDLDGFLVPNPAKRYAIGPFHPPLVKGRDGSIVVALQRDKPAELGVNWLPTPASGNFRLNLRIYEPARSALTGKWKPPPVKPLP